MTPHLQTGELLIITTVLLLWAGGSGYVCGCVLDYETAASAPPPSISAT